MARGGKSGTLSSAPGSKASSSGAQPRVRKDARSLDSGSEASAAVVSKVHHRKERLRRFKLQRTAARLVPEERVRHCRWSVISKAQGVNVVVTRYQRDDQAEDFEERASFEGLQTCGSVWHCPCCGRRISETRRGELNELLAWARSEGLYPIMVTLTARHTLADDLGDQLDGMKSAWERVQQRQEWRRLSDHIEGHVVATEVTRGDAHGWHTHFHVLVIVRPFNLRALVGQARQLRLEARAATRSWRAAVDVAEAVEHLAKTEERRLARREARKAERRMHKAWRAAAEAHQRAHQIRADIAPLQAMERAAEQTRAQASTEVLLELEHLEDALDQAKGARARSLFAWLPRVWRVSLQAFDLDADEIHGVQIQDASAAGRYVGKWGAAEELSLRDTKKGRTTAKGAKGRSPIEMLSDADAGDEPSARLWRTYAKTFKGRRQLVWSKNLKARIGLQEIEDEEAAKDQAQGEERRVAGNIQAGTWKGSELWLGARYRRGRILDAVEEEGAEGFERVVHDGHDDAGGAEKPAEGPFLVETDRAPAKVFAEVPSDTGRDEIEDLLAFVRAETTRSRRDADRDGDQSSGAPAQSTSVIGLCENGPRSCRTVPLSCNS